MATIETRRYPNIVSDPAVQGGAAVVRGTRVPVRTVAFYARSGWDERRILESFPRLTPETLAEVLRYYAEHRAEIDEELRADTAPA